MELKLITEVAKIRINFNNLMTICVVTATDY